LTLALLYINFHRIRKDKVLFSWLAILPRIA